MWKKFNGNKEDWDKKIIDLEGNYRQLYLWGETQKGLGWQVSRYTSSFDQLNVQILMKKFLFLKFFYIPGGVAGANKGYGDIKSLIKSLSPKTVYYVRLDSSYEDTDSSKNLFTKDGWTRPYYSINSTKTLYIDLAKDISDPMIDASKRWKKQLKRSRNNNIKILKNNNIPSEEILSTSQEMQKLKNVYLRDDPKNTSRLIEIFGDKVVLISCYDDKDQMLGFRCALCIGQRAWDFYAATTIDGRNLNVGYFLLYDLVEECKKRGAKRYILPISKTNKGDTEFKMRTGGELNNIVGEWNYSNVNLFLYLVNSVIYLLLNSKIIAFLRKLK